MSDKLSVNFFIKHIYFLIMMNRLFKTILPAAFLLSIICVIALKQFSNKKGKDPNHSVKENLSYYTTEQKSFTSQPNKRNTQTKPNTSNTISINPAETLADAFQSTESLTSALDDNDEQQALAEVHKLVRHSNREVRMIVIESIQWIGPSAAMDAASMIDDSDEEIRSIARDTFWQILQGLEDEQLKKQLLEIALTSIDPSVRTEALDELLYLPDELSVKLLKSATKDQNETVAKQARDNLSFILGE